MLSFTHRIAGIFLCICFYTQGHSAEVLNANKLAIGHCINMGNHLETADEKYAKRKIADDDFQIIAKAGFNTIRLPVKWSAHTEMNFPYRIDERFMQRVRYVVKLARDANLNIILNDHHYDALMKDPQNNTARLAEIWTQIATAFANESEQHLWFEIENEPHNQLTNANLIDVLNPALTAIRIISPLRPIIIGGDNWSSIDSLNSLELPDDPNIIPSFHYYAPFSFTHQGASWVTPIPPLGRAYGNKNDQELLTKDVEKMKLYIKKTRKIPFIGESGANELIPINERIKYQKAIRTAFEKINIDTCAWAYTNTFPLYDSKLKGWIPGMLDAMGLPENIKN